MKLKSEFDATCPCCHATLVIDTNLRRIVRHEEPVNPNRPELSDAHRLIAGLEAKLGPTIRVGGCYFWEAVLVGGDWYANHEVDLSVSTTF